MVASFKHLRDEKSFCDVTIATEVSISSMIFSLWPLMHALSRQILQGQHTKAHKMILCACSPYFKNLLEQNPAKHPIIILKVLDHFHRFRCVLAGNSIILKDVPFSHLTAILEFMYAGEVLNFYLRSSYSWLCLR